VSSLVQLSSSVVRRPVVRCRPPTGVVRGGPGVVQESSGSSVVRSSGVVHQQVSSVIRCHPGRPPAGIIRCHPQSSGIFRQVTSVVRPVVRCRPPTVVVQQSSGVVHRQELSRCRPGVVRVVRRPVVRRRPPTRVVRVLLCRPSSSVIRVVRQQVLCGVIRSHPGSSDR